MGRCGSPCARGPEGQEAPAEGGHDACCHAHRGRFFWKLPSGQDPGPELTLFHIPLSKGEGKGSAKVSILDPIPKFTVDYLELGPGAKVPIVCIHIDLFSSNADPTNIGAKARRVIHTRLLDSKLM